MQQLKVDHWDFSVWGGLNVADQADELYMRSTGADGLQIAPVESPDLLDVVFDSNGLAQRLGSAELDDLTGVMEGGETILGGDEYTNPATNSRTMWAIGTSSIYIEVSGTWQKIDGPDGSTAYLHAGTPAKWSVVQHDGHLVFCLDAANYNLGWRGGTNLDDIFYHSTTDTTVDQTSNSGQKVLSIAATAHIPVHCRVRINSGGGRDETGYVASVNAGVSITLQANLTYTHTAGQADAVVVENQYTETFGGDLITMTGAWDAGTYLGTSVRERLVLSTGNAKYRVFPVAVGGITPTGPWDGENSIDFRAPGRMRGFKTFIPEERDAMQEYLYGFFEGGTVIRSGFTVDDEHHRLDTGWSLMNNHCVVQVKNLMVCLTHDKRLIGLRGTTEVDLGRRLKASDGTGPLNDISASDAETDAKAFYDGRNSRAVFMVPIGTATDNDHAILLDFSLDQFGTGDEKVVRPLYWSGIDYVGIFQKFGGDMIGVRSTGKLYTMDSGTQDYGANDINGYWQSPDDSARAPHLHKQYLSHTLTGKTKGEWPVYVDYFKNRESGAALTASYQQATAAASVYGTATYGSGTYSSTAIIRGPKPRDVHLHAEVLAFKIRAANGNGWSVLTSTLRRLRAAEVRSP